MTGITNAMVRDAPTFFEIREALRALLTDAFFVAHNARFDYGFIKNEFRRVGEAFTSDALCTVRLSRALYPDADGHGLDAIIRRHRLSGFARHRAMGDVEATAAFVQHATDDHGADAVSAATKSLLKMPSLPAQLESNSIANLPDSPGVYLFYGINDLPIYIGKAKQLRERVRSHFSSDHMSSNDVRLSQELRRIEWQSTAGEFSALLLEAQWVKEKMPLHNIALRKRSKLGFYAISIGDDSVETAPLWFSADEWVAAQQSAEARIFYGPFNDKAAGKRWLADVTKLHRLCEHAVGISKPRGALDPCFARQVGRCLGACVDQETAQQHRERMIAALSGSEMPVWPFVGAVTFEERDEANDRVDLLQFDEWCALAGGVRLPFDVDVFKLIGRMLAKHADDFSGLRRIKV
ncbi:MAG: DNA polymerase III subunit epsilon [Betaproteobacteria bacterium]|nr:MAG: DNA polymerase III subunit epsilon [Betaproteobacteria bacterium]